MNTGTEARARRELVICFLDLSTYTMDARRTADDVRLAEMVDAYYERVGDHVARGGGTLVKFIGDGALAVFPTERADDAVEALLDLKRSVDAWLAAERWDSRLVVKLHRGDVVAGMYGARDHKTFDVIGDDVNITARLPTRSFALSAEAFRALSPAGRTLFKKHTPPLTYIPVEEPHPRGG